MIRQWLGQDHPKAVVDAVAFWLASVEVDGPPFDGVRVFPDDDLFMARIPATDVAVSYRITEYEFRIALDSIE